MLQNEPAPPPAMGLQSTADTAAAVATTREGMFTTPAKLAIVGAAVSLPARGSPGDWLQPFSMGFHPPGPRWRCPLLIWVVNILSLWVLPAQPRWTSAHIEGCSHPHLGLLQRGELPNADHSCHWSRTKTKAQGTPHGHQPAHQCWRAAERRNP